MLHVVVFMHCDGCNAMYKKLHTSIQSDPCDWPEGLVGFTLQAKKDGWYVGTNWSSLFCTSCNEELSNVEF
jgi:hypothetical protein